jgi:Pyruvate/2-oxoacid:ferredoxin oxidoreductase delta subunit
MLTPSNQYLQAVEEINDYVNQAKCRACRVCIEICQNRLVSVNITYARIYR